MINKLLSEQVDAILISPKFMRYWVAMLWQLPIVNERELSWFDGMYSIVSWAPDHMEEQQAQKCIDCLSCKVLIELPMHFNLQVG